MNNQNETLGLRVLSVSPSHLESSVNVNTSISVTFTSDINPSTLTKNIVVFEDYNKKNLLLLKEKDDLTDKDFDVELIDKKIKTILSELTDSSIDDIKSFTNN